MLKEDYLPEGHVFMQLNYVPWKAAIPGAVTIIRKEPQTMEEAKRDAEQNKRIPDELLDLGLASRILPSNFPRELLAQFSLVGFLSQTQSLCDISYSDGTVRRKVRIHSLLFNAMAERRPPETIQEILNQLKIIDDDGKIYPLQFEDINEISPFYYTPATNLILCLVT